MSELEMSSEERARLLDLLTDQHIVISFQVITEKTVLTGDETVALVVALGNLERTLRAVYEGRVLVRHSREHPFA